MNTINNAMYYAVNKNGEAFLTSKEPVKNEMEGEYIITGAYFFPTPNILNKTFRDDPILVDSECHDSDNEYREYSKDEQLATYGSVLGELADLSYTTHSKDHVIDEIKTTLKREFFNTYMEDIEDAINSDDTELALQYISELRQEVE